MLPASYQSPTTNGEVLTSKDWTPREAADYVSESWRNAVESIIETGLRLVEARERVGHGNWLAAVELMPFGEDSAQLLMKIGRHPVLANTDYSRYLPASWRTLSLLAQLPDEEVVELIDNGTVTSDLTQSEAKKTTPSSLTCWPRN